MRHSRSIITAAIIIAIAVFVVAAVSSFISGTSEHYDRPSSPEQVLEKMSEAVESTDETTQVEETTTASEQVSQAAQQEAEALESNTEEEVLNNTNEAVESAIETAKETSKTVSDRADEAIAAAENSAAEGRADAEARLQEVEKEAGITEEPAEVAEPATVESKNHTVTAQGLIYEPLVLTIAPGDSVSWTNMSTHNTESIEGLIPEGAEMWMSEMSENFSRTFTQEGIYIYKCTPHFGAGMGGAIIVGKPVNLEQIKNSGAKGAAKRLVNKAVQAAEAM
ncbi:plastocyanin/azurin family copper-binding protein [Methylophaga pinxianii]|uniref:plastocyanin/azurin family copper-binding protein n=1 Tax=Methylophaga pinxianii TaxID=2881052 RepID=UPI001CF38ACF|nr:plastocyanin/azurin family copper-binding protein [Methylophaga pinxianii]MCB2427106.1 pseudoazurin precursor [Methylophaga pinxianii]UPH45996.1 plastocyanin/azurin family copper-binding protein [Methylophaga pinxianii]